jgi:imidazolonepropionase-like amidohydrolase
MAAQPSAAASEKALSRFIDKFEPAHRSLIRAVRQALRKRLPAAHELAYNGTIKKSLRLPIPIAAVLWVLLAAPAFSDDLTDRLLDRRNAAAGQVTVFENVNVVPMDAERVLSNQTVVIRFGQIYAIGPADQSKNREATGDAITGDSIPAGAQRIDGRGKYLIPGLADMHFHLPGPDASPEEIEAYLLFFVANGVTTVRSTIGQSNHIAIRDSVTSGNLFGPRLYLAGYPLHSKQATAGAARALVYRSKAEGFDQIKFFDVRDTTVFDAAVQAAEEVSLPCFGHVKSEIGIDRAIEAGQSSEHLSGYLRAVQADESRLASLVRATRDANVWTCPTQFFFECLYERDLDRVLAYEGVASVPPATRDAWAEKRKQEIAEGAANAGANAREIALRRRILAALHEGGAKILLGADTPHNFMIPGFSILEEMRAFARAGLAPYAILETGTRNPAESLGILDEAGTIEVGKRADLVLLDANPLESIDHVAKRAGVMLGGAWFEREELDAAARAAAAALQ